MTAFFFYCKIFPIPPAPTVEWGSDNPSVGAMKIARNPGFSDRPVEWHAFVGAMKIARNVAVSGRHDEWHAFVGAMKIARNLGF